MPLQKPCYIDPRTGRDYELSDVRWRSDDGHPMMVTELAGIDRQDIDTRLRSMALGAWFVAAMAVTPTVASAQTVTAVFP